VKGGSGSRSNAAAAYDLKCGRDREGNIATHTRGESAVGTISDRDVGTSTHLPKAVHASWVAPIAAGCIGTRPAARTATPADRYDVEGIQWPLGPGCSRSRRAADAAFGCQYTEGMQRLRRRARVGRRRST
jgi:hypothetical protein